MSIIKGSNVFFKKGKCGLVTCPDVDARKKLRVQGRENYFLGDNSNNLLINLAT